MSTKHFTAPGTEIYWDQGIYEREMQAIYGSAWLFVGHESMIPHAGDFITNYMGNDPVIVVRDRSNAPRVFLNRCRHRGNKVCLHDSGSTKSFRCSYHGWTYGLAGDLAAVPLLDKAYDADFPRDELGLVSAARVTTYHGMIFATWNINGPSLDDFLGADLRWYLETFVFDDPEGLEVLPGRHRYLVPGNWKMLSENFGGDMYHFASTHASVAMLGRAGQADRIQANNDLRGNETAFYSVECRGDRGIPHGLVQLTCGPGTNATEVRQAETISPDAVRWVRERHERRRRLLGDRPSEAVAFHTGTIWPNLSMNGFGAAFYARTFLQWQPRGPEETDAWQWAFVEKSAPPEVKERMAFVLTQRQSAAGMVAPDDMDNFQRMHDVLHTARAGKLGFNYDLGAKNGASLIPGLPGFVMEAVTERYHRSFYEYWDAVMGASRH